MAERQAHYPGRAPIDAYGNGGFRFAQMSHRGSLLLLPSGVYAWPIKEFDDLAEADFELVFSESERIDFVLLGTGTQQHFPAAALRDAFAAADVGLEPMATGAACRTYNVLLAEQRAVAAALIAVP